MHIHPNIFMKILVFNAGSSSLKFGVFDLTQTDSRICKGEYEGFSSAYAKATIIELIPEKRRTVLQT